MAKKPVSSHQSSLFRREIPRMPDGYYTPGPNPNLRQFVEEHAKPYNLSTDQYSKSDFSAELVGNRHTAEYNFLGYSSKKPYEPITEYLLHFSDPGDLILDPFSGSGGVGYVAACYNRKAVLIDSSPLAAATSAAYVTPVDSSEVSLAFDKLSQMMLTNRYKLYGTVCRLCGGKGEVITAVHSQTYRCLKCFNVVALADCGDDSVCPFCKEKVSTRQKRMGIVPWAVEVKCLEGCKQTQFQKIEEKYIKDALAEAPITDEIRLFQQRRMMDFDGDSDRWGLLWRPYHEGIEHISDFFTPRNLFALLDIKNAIINLSISDEARRVLLLGLASIVPSASRQQRYYPGSTFPNMVMPGVLYVPPVYEEINVYKRFLSKSRTLVAGVGKISENIKSISSLISTQSSTELQ